MKCNGWGEGKGLTVLGVVLAVDRARRCLFALQPERGVAHLCRQAELEVEDAGLAAVLALKVGGEVGGRVAGARDLRDEGQRLAAPHEAVDTASTQSDERTFAQPEQIIVALYLAPAPGSHRKTVNGLRRRWWRSVCWKVIACGQRVLTECRPCILIPEAVSSCARNCDQEGVVSAAR